jgi:SAM-dependent methyltransferase
VISPQLFGLVRCPDCGGAVDRADGAVRCASCGRAFDDTRGYLDMRPRDAFVEQTKYLDDALHQDARHETVSPPLLGSKIRHDMLRRFLAPGPKDRVLDLGCGSGRTLVWTTDTGAETVGIDISPFFSRDALERCDLILGDLRRSPLRDDAFTKAWSLDVLEHLSPEALRGMLSEAHRVLADDGALFVYTHVRKNGWPAKGVRLVNQFAHLCERLGLIDLRQERLRKSDHLNPIADHDELARVTAACGFRIERVTYYTPIIGALVENVFVRMVERVMSRRARQGPASENADAAAVRAARATAKARLTRRGWEFRALLALTWIMKLDLVLFGRIQSGPFFALLKKTSRPA